MSTNELDQFDLFGAARREQIEQVEYGAPSSPDGLPDADARRRIREDLDTSLLVEAGAGAGKTTEMVRRMVALVVSGRAAVHQVAAVTFTRKAASELRERFQTSLEQALRDARARADTVGADRIDRALRDIDRAFLGTIHAFCARLLRERPLEAGLDPGFRELLGGEERRERLAFWNRHIERLTNESNDGLAQMQSAGVEPRQVLRLFVELNGQPDVMFPSGVTPRPVVMTLRRQIERVMDDAAQLGISGRRDNLQAMLAMFRYHRFVAGWEDDARFLDAIARVKRDSFNVSPAAWLDADAARAIRKSLDALFAGEGAAVVMLREWWEYRYPLVVSFARNAERAYAQDRIRNGTLNFQDLLMHAASLLKSSAGARHDLGERNRYLLVDEFQDTDPVQAEVLFLLTSEPTTGNDDWRHAAPRPGALFVVGDPRQSIYRFRRADMSLYTQVKARFAEWGAVVHLNSNFRSGAPVERFVNDNFEDRFPAESTAEQAQFAPLRAQPKTSPHPSQGVYWYDAGEPYERMEILAQEEAMRLAAWIKTRIESGERKPGDFLLLTRNTARLATYGAALEALDIPSQVTGAGIIEKEELRELRVLLRALSDPGDPTLTVAVLTGLFHGIDFDQLMEHVETHGKRAAFAYTRVWREPHTPVTAALMSLRQYWLWARDMPADIAVTKIVRDAGLLPYAAAGNLGRTRAGALLYAMDAIRMHAIDGDSSIEGAIAALDAALEENESEAPLEPGRTDVVRVMNLHKAKGLEAPVVILAHPFEMPPRPPHMRIERQRDGTAHGFTQVTERGARNQVTVIAQPQAWESHVATEQRFQEAENERVLYVAATRAADELVIGTMIKRGKPSPWRVFHRWLRDHGTRITLPLPVTEPRPVLASSDAPLAAAAAADAARAAMRAPTYRASPVTARKAALAASIPDPDLAASAPEAFASPAQDEIAAPYRVDGTTWGTVMHDALEQVGRGAAGEEVRQLCHGLLMAAERPVDQSGAPAELDELLALIGAVVKSAVWQRAQRADVRLVEVPFGLRLRDEDYAAMGGLAMAPVEIIDGRIDLAFREGGAWTIVDYKSDGAGSRVPAELLDRYRAQVRLYAEAFARITGEPVVERALLFAADGAIVTF